MRQTDKQTEPQKSLYIAQEYDKKLISSLCRSVVLIWEHKLSSINESGRTEHRKLCFMKLEAMVSHVVRSASIAAPSFSRKPMFSYFHSLLWLLIRFLLQKNACVSLGIWSVFFYDYWWRAYSRGSVTRRTDRHTVVWPLAICVYIYIRLKSQVCENETNVPTFCKQAGSVWEPWRRAVFWFAWRETAEAGHIYTLTVFWYSLKIVQGDHVCYL
jgi:hypothetical protein